MDTQPLPVPIGLREAGRALWNSVTQRWAENELEPDPREQRLLADACREADIAAALDTEIDKALNDGQMVVKGSQGQPVAHPLLSEARASRTSIRATLAKLGFEDPDDEEEKHGGRGSRTTSASARAAAFARHGRSA